MTIFRLNFLLKVGQIEMCQNPSFISTRAQYLTVKGPSGSGDENGLNQPGRFSYPV